MTLREALAKKRFVVTSEVQTPIDEKPEDLVNTLRPLRGRVEGVSLTKIDLQGVVGDTVKTCRLLKDNRIEPIYQTTTRNKNRPELQTDLLEAREAGIENLLVFTEDYRITGDSLQEMMFFHVDAGKLQSVLEHLRDGRTVGGDLAAPSRFFSWLRCGVHLGKTGAGPGTQRDGGDDQNRGRVFSDNPRV